MNTTPWLVTLLAPCAFVWGCATGPEVSKSISLTIEVRHKDGRLQWRQTVLSESGTDDPPPLEQR